MTKSAAKKLLAAGSSRPIEVVAGSYELSRLNQLDFDGSAIFSSAFTPAF